MATTFGEIIEQFEKNGKKYTLEWLIEKAPSETNKISLKKKYEKVLNQYKNLKKSKSHRLFETKFDSFTKEVFPFPHPKVFQRRKSGTELEVQNVQDMNMAKNVIGGLAADFSRVSKVNEELKTENKTMGAKLKLRQATKYRLVKQIEVKKYFKRQVKHLQTVLNKKQQQMKQIRSAKSYDGFKRWRAEEQLDQKKQEINNLKIEIDNLMHDLLNLKKEKNELLSEKENIESLYANSNNRTVFLFDEDKHVFTTETQECVYKLLTNNVTSSNVSKVIANVLNLVGIKPNRLPSTSTVNNMNVQRLLISQKQLGEIIQEEDNLCLMSDETSKFGKKMEGFHISTENRNEYVLGTRQIVTKSGLDTLNVLNEILSDINTATYESGNEISQKAVLKITSTMSDRAATQIKFNELLQIYRTEVLSEVMFENWSSMCEIEKLSLTTMNNFFCGLHSLVHIAECASESLKVLEEAFFEGKVPIYDVSFRNNETATVRLIRTASKAFSCGGDEKSGVYGNFQTFAKEFLALNKLNSVPIKRFHGNRFNILFENSTNVYFMKGEIKKYLSFDTSNRLLQSIYHDIQIPYLLAGMKSLGLIHYCITTPLWRFIERKDVHIIESCQFFKSLCQYIEKCEENIDDFVAGLILMDGVDSERLAADVKFRVLITESEIDDMVCMILASMIPAILKTMKKLFQDFIQGGKWECASEETKMKTKSVPLHNKFSESIFGHIDRLLREKPNISFIAQEAYVMFCHNKTNEWLNELNESTKKEIMIKCRKEVKDQREKFRARRQEIERRRKEIILQKIKEKEEKEIRKQKKLEKHTTHMIDWGLWQTEEQVDHHLKTMKTNKEKISALKSQLNFRKEILQQKPKDDVYKLSKMLNGRRVALSVQDLTANVKSLIQHSYTISVNGDQTDQVQLVGRDVSMLFKTDDGELWYNGHVISKVPGYPSWFNIKFDGDRAVYTYELLKDFAKGDLKIRVDSMDKMDAG